MALGRCLPLSRAYFPIYHLGSINQRLGVAWWLRAQVLASDLAGSESLVCHLPAL